MADGDLTLKLDDETARRLEAAAVTAGRSVAELAAEFISSGLSDWDAADWAQVDRICDETIVRGDGVSIDALRPWLQAWGKDAPPSR